MDSATAGMWWHEWNGTTAGIWMEKWEKMEKNVPKCMKELESFSPLADDTQNGGIIFVYVVVVVPRHFTIFIGSTNANYAKVIDRPGDCTRISIERMNRSSPMILQTTIKWVSASKVIWKSEAVAKKMLLIKFLTRDTFNMNFAKLNIHNPLQRKIILRAQSVAISKPSGFAHALFVIVVIITAWWSTGSAVNVKMMKATRCLR